jgi:hypothetical protein
MPEVKESHLLYYRLCFSCVFTIFLLLVIEAGSALALRVLSSRHTNYLQMSDSSIYTGKAWAQQYWSEERALKVSYQAYVGWRAFPSSGQTINVGPDFHRQTAGAKCSGTEFTIWMFGGSTMWGTGSPDWETIPSHVADLLAKSGAPACVRNFGQTGWRNTQEVIELELALKREPRKPDLVIFYDGYNEGYAFYQSGEFDVHMNYDIIRAQLEDSSETHRGGYLLDFLVRTHTGRLITGAWRRPSTVLGGYKIPAPPPNPTDDEAKRDLEISYLDNFDIVSSLAQQYGFQYAFFWQPVIFEGHKPLTSEEQNVLHFYSSGIQEAGGEYRAMQARLGSGTPGHFFDISNLFDGVRDTLYIDFVHVGPAGNQLVAQRMRDLLNQAGWLRSRATSAKAAPILKD